VVSSERNGPNGYDIVVACQRSLVELEAGHRHSHGESKQTDGAAHSYV